MILLRSGTHDSKVFIEPQNNKKLNTVRKESDKNFIDMKKEIKFLISLNKKQLEHFPDILDYSLTEDTIFYTMPFYTMPTLRDSIFNSSIKIDFHINLINKILNFLVNQIYSVNLINLPDENFLRIAHINRVKNRLLTFINPDLDPLGAGYQIIQSKTALGSGGFLGKGWGEGTQTHLKFLPVQESDFIVSVIGEEFGFITLLVMLILFIWMIIKILKLAFTASDRFSGLILVGISTIFATHLFVNCGMTSGLIPVKGLPLPFISYGGSFLVSSYMMVGLVLNFGREEID